MLAVEVDEVHSPDYKVKHFRVDRMEKVDTLNKYDGRRAKPLCAPQIEDIENYTKQNFSMYGGKVEKVTIQFPDYLAWVVIDRFGLDVRIKQAGKGYFQITESIAVSPQFYGWLFGLEKEVKIIEPPQVVQEIKALLKDTYAVYTVKRNHKKKSESSQLV